MQRLDVPSFLALFLSGSSALLAQPFNRSDVIVGVHPHAVVAGDFNGDRGADVAAITEEGVFVILNRGYSDVPAVPVHTEGVSGQDLITGFYAQFAAAADFNSDGLEDLVSNGVLLLSNGDGTFRVARRDLAVVVGIGDFNGDGKIDLLQSDPDPGIEPGHGVRVLLGNGDGTFRPGATITTVRVEQVVVADFNHDGRLDVAVMPHGLPANLLIFIGQGDGTFSSAIQTDIPFALQWMYLAADFNGDGIPDLTAPGGIALGKGDGTFQSPIPYPRGFPGFPIAAADFTGDGHVDLVTSDLVGSVFVYPGNGDGTLLPPTVQPVGWGVLPRAAVLDLEYPYIDSRRGYHLDLVTTSGSSNSVTFLLNYLGGANGTTLQRAVSAATGNALVAPGSLATLFGPTPATASLAASPPWPTSLGGISLQIEEYGDIRPAPLLYVSPTQINFQVPSDLKVPGFHNLTIVDDHGKSYYVGGMGLDSVAPGLFLLSYAYGPPAATAIRVEADGTQVSLPVYTCAPSATGSACDLSPIPLSAGGDHPIYLSFFGTGFHGATPDNVTCEINGVQVPVVYAGPQETPGVDQINVQLLPKVLEGFFGETMPVIIRIDGVPANSTLIAVR
jgi:uncharacterized protein (TIGR03437 family)